jgi:hypothetical protein
MTDQIVALCVSGLALLMLALLFKAEHSRGQRFFGSLRSHLDFWLLKVRHVFNVRLRNWSRYFIRQIIHYFLHTVLTGAIVALDTIEERLKNIARSNRVLAKKSDKERSQMNKLEEVALHKLEVALTDEEKRIRRRQSLEG